MPIATPVDGDHLSTFCANDDRSLPPRLDPAFFDEITATMHAIKSCQKEEQECLKKIDKMHRAIEEGKGNIARGRAARDTLKRRNDTLNDKLQEREARIHRAVEYWKDYGLDIKEISRNKYEFIFSKLPAPMSTCSVVLAYESDELQIVDPPEFLEEVSKTLTSRCVDKGQVDYKLAMLLIRKELIKHKEK